MKNILFIVCLLIPIAGIGQNPDSAKVITLHPITGKVITLEEKKEYSLFPEYKDEAFISAEVLKYNDTTYTIRFRTTKGTAFERTTDTNELDSIYAAVDSKKQELVNRNNPQSERRNELPKRNRVNISAEDAITIAFIASRVVLGILILTMR